MAANEYNDLPMILSMEGFDYTAYGTEHSHHGSSCRYPYNTLESNDAFLPADVHGHGVAIGRFMKDPYAVTPCLLQANVVNQSVEHDLILHNPHFGYHRQISPCSSGQSSDPSQGELRSPHAYYQSYGSPEEFFSRTTAPYPRSEKSYDEGYMSQAPLQGGCSLRQLEYNSDPSVGGLVDIEVREEIPVEHARVATHVEIVAEEHHDDADSGIGNSVRDAESVQPMDMEHDPASDSDFDYTPTSKGSGKRRRSPATKGNKASKRRNSTRKDSSASSSSGSACGTRTITKSPGADKAPANPTDPPRSFPCTLANYGCSLTFTSKNEWKRHMSTQHIKLGYWRCDLCRPTVDSHDDSILYYNDFNRKDLFTQHLRRMHAVGTKTASQKSPAAPDANLIKHQTRCRKQLRLPPQRSACLFCDKEFEGSTSWEERMEHVGKHLEKDRKSLPDMLDPSTWKEDKDLEVYLVAEDLIIKGDDNWKIGDGKPIRQALDETDSEAD